MKFLVLTFRSEEGNNVTLRLRYPKDGLTSQEVNNLMDTIIAKNIFASPSGDLVGKVSAAIQDTEAQTFQVS
ncbi:MAG: DUF2922 domain-containing protein [Candidatus Caldatribacteriaceae bacterium]